MVMMIIIIMVMMSIIMLMIIVVSIVMNMIIIVQWWLWRCSGSISWASRSVAGAKEKRERSRWRWKADNNWGEILTTTKIRFWPPLRWDLTTTEIKSQNVAEIFEKSDSSEVWSDQIRYFWGENLWQIRFFSEEPERQYETDLSYDVRGQPSISFFDS